MIIAGACTSKLPLSGTTEQCCGRPPRLLCPCSARPGHCCKAYVKASVAWPVCTSYVDFEFGFALNGENASPLELVGVDRGCQISRVLSCSFHTSFYLVLTHHSGMMRTMMMPLTRIRSVANVVERLLKGCSHDNWKVLVEACMQLAVGIQVLL